MSGKRILVGVLVIAVALVVITGIMIIGSPSEERTRRMDSRRVDHLQRISSAINVYYRRHQQVPASLEELAKEPGLGSVERDPVTNEPYSYRVFNAMSYELCAAFDRETSDGRRADFWAHGAGRQCFAINIKPSE